MGILKRVQLFIYLTVGNLSQYVIFPLSPPKGIRSQKRKAHNFGQNAAAQNDLKHSQNGQDCTYTHTYTHIKRNVPTPKGLVPPRRGGKGAGKPKDDRATAKRNVP